MLNNGKCLLLILLLGSSLWAAPSENITSNEIIVATDVADPDLTPPATTELDRSADNATESLQQADDDGSSKTLLFVKELIKFKPLHKILYDIAFVLNRLWSLVVEVVWKPLLRLYFKPLRLIHSYLLPELINAECFDVYHADIHRFQNPLKPFRPNKLELVKCIVQYLSHYFRSWQFVNRIEQNNYDLE